MIVVKKLICVFVVLAMAFFAVGCSEQENTTEESVQSTLVTYEDIDDTTKQLLTDYMDKINLILELNWGNEYANELRYEAEEFKKVLEILYEDSTGQPFPQENGRAQMETYLDIASQYFKLNSGYLRHMLSMYTYDFATDTVQVAPDVDADGILTIRDICQKDGVYEINFSRKYETYDRETDSYKLGKITGGQLKVELNEDGSCVFISNHIYNTEYNILPGQRWETYMSLRTYALGDILNYSWNEENEGSLFVDDNYKAIQYSVEKMYRLYNIGDFPSTEEDVITRYVNYATKFFNFGKDMFYEALGVSGAKDAYPECDYVTDDNHFILFKSMRSEGDYVYVEYTNGIRSYDSHTGRYHLLDAVNSTLVYKRIKADQRLKAVANINAYYDVQDKERYQDYLELLAPALETEWDETAYNELTNDTQLMKVVLQNIYLNQNWKNKADDNKYSLTQYEYATEKFFVFGMDGLTAMLEKDETYDAENQLLQTAVNIYEDADVNIVDVEYEDGYRIVNYSKNGKNGMLTVKVYPDGREKIAANTFGTRRLTLRELESINEYYRNTKQWQYILWHKFDSPQNIDINSIVNKLPAENELTYANYYEIKLRKEAGVELDYYRLEKGLEEYGRVSAKTVEKLLKDTMNITVDDIAQKANYSEKYATFYKTDNYGTFVTHQFIDGYVKDNIVTVYAQGVCLTLEKVEGKYYIKSLTSTGEKEIKDIYAENGISTETQYLARDEYIAYDLSKADIYNNAMYEYNEFLAGRRKVDGYKLSPREWEGDSLSPVVGYSLFDMNSDGVPELILAIPYNVYEVYSYDSEKGVVKWDVKFSGGMSTRSVICTDGIAGFHHVSTGANCGFYRYDAEGNCIEIMEFDWYEPYDEYDFNGRKVTKEEFEKLSDPWLDRFDNENHIEFNSYLKEVEYWETYAEVLQGQ